MSLDLPKKKYQIIYADPPWSYKDSKRPYGVANRYQTISLQGIKNLPVNNIAAKNCVLFIWIVYPMFSEGLEVLNAWGFEYKTLGFQWIKMNKKKRTPFLGVGCYTRSNSEGCLIAIKGKPKRIDMSVSQIIQTPITKHSEKPPMVRDKIIQLYGDLPRIELFARHKVIGWDSWGFEISNKELKFLPKNQQTSKGKGFFN